MDIPHRDIINTINNAESLGLLKIKDKADFERLCNQLSVDAEFREKLCEQIKRKIKEDEALVERYTPQPTQKEQRELKRKQREAEQERVKLTQQDILNKCNSDGCCKVAIIDLKNAFPKMISQIDGNNFRAQIDHTPFRDFLISNGLTFSFPDFVFKKQA